MIRIGVTGGIGSGKSTVCELFERLGIPVYNSDRRARALMGDDSASYAVSASPNMAAIAGNTLREAIIDLLGPDAYRGTEPDREFIAAKVFADSELLTSLDEIVHPAVAEDFEAWALAAENGATHQPPPYIILESAILFESGFHRFVDKTIAVSAPEAIRLERVMARGGISREDAARRIANQISDPERGALADYTIDNAGGLDELAARVAELDKLLK